MTDIEEESNEDLEYPIETFKDKDLPVLLNQVEKITISKRWRPTDYNYDILYYKYCEYIHICEDSWQRLVKSRTRGSAFDSDGFDYKLKVKLPSIEGYALHVGFVLDTIYDWEKKHPEFSDIIYDLRQRQVEKLIEWGISGKYNSHISKILLSKHGYVEQSESDLTIKWGLQISFARPASPFNTAVWDKNNTTNDSKNVDGNR